MRLSSPRAFFILHVGARTSAVRGPKGCQIRAEVLIDPLLKADMATFQELVSPSFRQQGQASWTSCQGCRWLPQDKSITMMDSG